MTTDRSRILIISHGHPALAAGCAEMAAYDLFRDLNQSGAAAASFLGCVADQKRPAPSNGTVQSCDGSRNEYLLHVGEFDSFMLAHGIDSRSLDDFGQLLDAIRPDIVHFHHLNLIGAESLALVRNRLPRARIIFTLHDFHPICYRGGLMSQVRSDTLCEQASADSCHACFGDIAPARFALRRDHLRNMLGLVDRFVAPSRFLRRRYTDWGIPGPAIDHIPHGLPEEIRPLAGTGPRRRNRFGFFGNIAPHKGPLVALEALKRIDPAADLTLLIHGALEYQSGAFFSAFDKALDDEGARARYQGPYARRDVARLMNAVDWVVVPSTWWEAAPHTILESFRLGRPVIAADAGGMAEMVEHEVNGFLFRHGDPADLARTMQAAAGNTDVWDRMAASLPAVPAMAAVTARHLALYGDLLEQPRSRTA